MAAGSWQSPVRFFNSASTAHERWHCDSGYSCAYSANISWRSESDADAKEVNPGWCSSMFGNQIQRGDRISKPSVIATR